MSPAEPVEKSSSSLKLDMKFQEFLGLLVTERDSIQKFDAKLSELAVESEEVVLLDNDHYLEGSYLEEDEDEGRRRRRYAGPKRVRIIEDKAEKEEDKVVGLVAMRGFNQTLEEFLERMHEEKIKNEKFNSKLNSVSNY